MNAPTDLTSLTANQQIVTFQGRPVAVVLPYEEYLALLARGVPVPISGTPQEVMRKRYVEGKSLIQAWREHLNLSQREVAKKLGTTQAAYQQMEKRSVRPRKSTLIKLAQAFDLDPELLLGFI